MVFEKNHRFYPGGEKYWFKQGEVSHNSGKPLNEWMSKESNELRKKKISETLKKKYASGERVSFFEGRALRKGVKHSEETIQKFKEAKLGCSLSPEHRIKISKAHKARREKHHLWKGGIRPLNKKLRESTEYKLWREAVFERDDYTCQFCGERGGELNADHVISFATCRDWGWNEFITDVDNGQTLCVPCHREKTFGVS